MEKVLIKIVREESWNYEELVNRYDLFSLYCKRKVIKDKIIGCETFQLMNLLALDNVDQPSRIDRIFAPHTESICLFTIGNHALASNFY